MKKKKKKKICILQPKIYILFFIEREKPRYIFIIRISLYRMHILFIRVNVSACVQYVHWIFKQDCRLEKRDNGGRRKQSFRCEYGNVALIVINSKGEKMYATIQEKIFHVLAKQQQTNDKRVYKVTARNINTSRHTSHDYLTPTLVPKIPQF